MFLKQDNMLADILYSGRQPASEDVSYLRRKRMKRRWSSWPNTEQLLVASSDYDVRITPCFNFGVYIYSQACFYLYHPSISKLPRLQIPSSPPEISRQFCLQKSPDDLQPTPVRHEALPESPQHRSLRHHYPRPPSLESRASRDPYPQIPAPDTLYRSSRP